MVAYQPPDAVVLSVGAYLPSEALLAAAKRVEAQARKDAARLAKAGVTEEELDRLAKQIKEVRVSFTDPRAKKNDTPLQMAGVTDTMARIRGWLRTLRLVAAVNLGLDTPALERIASSAPELVDGYPRDLLAELKRKLNAATDLRPRIEDGGLNRAFLARGRRLMGQLETAIGERDLDPNNLHFSVRRLYARKGQLYVSLKRVVRAGLVTCLDDPTRAAAYHLDELEPTHLDDPFEIDKPAGIAGGASLPPITRPR